MDNALQVENKMEFICPVCRKSLMQKGDEWNCESCEKHYAVSANGSPNFLVGPGFGEDDDPERNLHEESTAKVTVDGYLLPLLNRIFPNADRSSITILDVGCGVGMYVDLLCGAGYDAWGVDSGRHRPDLWSRRKNAKKLVLAEGDAMPFPDNTFDFLFCAGVIEHVGCDGDARTPSPGYEEARFKFARDNVRVVKKDGYLNYTCPNRHFPYDLWHRNVETNPFRFHWPWDPFLFTMGDFRRLFLGQCGCQHISALPIKGYQGFLRLNKTVLQRLGCRAAKIWFDTIGCWPVLRGSFANPWLSALIKK